MTVQTKTIGRLPVNLGDYDSTRAYGRKNRVLQYGCELESLVDNNTYDPMTWDGSETFTLDSTHWRLVSGNPDVWAAGNDKPATTGTTGDHPYNGMGRVVLKKNMVGGVNVLTEDAFYTDGSISGQPLENTIFVIKYDFVLGENITIPANCVLKFEGGSISGDGTGKDTITGTDTQIRADKVAIFTGIVIAGTWNVPYITSAWFSDAANNRLPQLINLSNSEIFNHIFIEYGTYNVSVPNDGGVALNVKSNTELTIDGEIDLIPNAYGAYNIIGIIGVNNVLINGSGTIKGDKDTHLDTRFQSGHCINVSSNSNNIEICGLTIKKPWGDCILLSDGTNLIVKNCTLIDGRRQGISIGNAERVEIINVDIQDVSGAPKGPCAGIDIEPTNTAKDIYLCNIHVTGASGYGLSLISEGTMTGLRNVVVDNYEAYNCSGEGLAIIYNCNNIIIRNSRFESVSTCLNFFAMYDDGDHAYSLTSLQDNVVIENCRFNKLPGDESTPSLVCIIRRYGVSIRDCYFTDDNKYSYFRVHKTQGYDTVINNCGIRCEQIYNTDKATFKNCNIDVKNVIDSGNNVLYEDCTIQTEAAQINDKTTIHVMGLGAKFIRNTIIGAIKVYADPLSHLSVFDGNRVYSNNNNAVVLLTLVGANDAEGTIISNNLFNYYEGNHSYPVSSCIYLGSGRDNITITNNLFDLNGASVGIGSQVAYTGKVICRDNIGINSNVSGAGILTNLIRDGVYKAYIENYKYPNRGITGGRPLLEDNDYDIGFMYFDTTLGKPIYWNGSAWVDATGAAV